MPNARRFLTDSYDMNSILKSRYVHLVFQTKLLRLAEKVAKMHVRKILGLNESWGSLKSLSIPGQLGVELRYRHLG